MERSSKLGGPDDEPVGLAQGAGLALGLHLQAGLPVEEQQEQPRAQHGARVAQQHPPGTAPVARHLHVGRVRVRLQRPVARALGPQQPAAVCKSTRNTEKGQHRGRPAPGGGGGSRPIQPGSLPPHPPGHVTVTGMMPEQPRDFWRYPRSSAGTGRERGWAGARPALPATFPARLLLVCSLGLLLAFPSFNHAPIPAGLCCTPKPSLGNWDQGSSLGSPQVGSQTSLSMPEAEPAHSLNPGWIMITAFPRRGSQSSSGEAARGTSTELGAVPAPGTRGYFLPEPGLGFQEGTETSSGIYTGKTAPAGFLLLPVHPKASLQRIKAIH